MNTKDPSAVHQAALIIKKGRLVAFPTETVYGLAADATNPAAVAQIFEVKGRPWFDPLIVHVGAFKEALSLWRVCPAKARRLIQEFWPGPLTIVLPKTGLIPDIVTAGLATVALRMPDHKVAQSLIREAGRPLAAPSANRFGRPSPTTAQAVREELGNRVDCVLDAGPTPVGIESTVVAFRGNRAVLLRPGGIPLEDIERIVGKVVVRRSIPSNPSSPGMLSRHYAPETPLYLLKKISDRHHFPAKRFTRKKLALLAFFRQTSEDLQFFRREILAPNGNLTEAAAKFFENLRRLDSSGADLILAELPPPRGLGLAMRDRLEKASSGRAFIKEGKLFLIPRV